MELSHFSEQPDIREFVPRPAPNSSQTGEMVWAVDEAHMHNYLLPRDCPRVCFCRGPATDAADWQRLSCGSQARAVVSIEAAWFPAMRAACLYRYILPPATFSCIDAEAGYYVSRELVVPERVEVIDDLPAALLARNVELRITPSLWPLRDLVIGSSVQFSIIRMRNAARPDDYVPVIPL